MDAWQRLFRDEQEALNFLLREEFTEMTDNWFVQHPEVMRYILKHEQVAAAIATECRIACEQEAICCECGATCPLDDVYNGYEQSESAPCGHSWYSYRYNGQYVLE